MEMLWFNARGGGRIQKVEVNLRFKNQMSEHKKSRTLPHARSRRSGQEPAIKTIEKRPARDKDTIVLAGISSLIAKESVQNLAGFLELLLKYG